MVVDADDRGRVDRVADRVGLGTATAPGGRTIGEIAKQEGRNVFAIQYVVKSRRIRPACRAGIIRLFDDRGVDEVRAALAEVDGRRGRRASR